MESEKHNHVQPEKSPELNEAGPIFKTYDGKELFDNQKKFSELTQSYIEIFNASGDYEWEEDWDVDEASDLLKSSLLQKDSKNIVTLLEIFEKENSSKVAGFGLGHIGNRRAVILPEQMPKDLDADERIRAIEEIQKRFSSLDSSEQPILYTQDLGILKAYRGGTKRVAGLVEPMVKTAAEAGAPQTTYWTSKKSKLYILQKVINSKEIYRFHDEKDNVLLSVDTIDLLNTLEKSEDEINRLIMRNL